MFETDYPDVLGTLTDGKRLELPSLQCAMGVFPGGSALGQPFELLVLLQSTIDQPQTVTLSVRLPRKDGSGRPLRFFLSKKQVTQVIEPGVLHIPVVAQPPTPPARGYPVIVKIEAEPQAPPRMIRTPGPGRPPSTLGVSPFRLDVLKDVTYIGQGKADELHARFDVIPGQVKIGLSNPTAKYETLWSRRDFQAEQKQIGQSIALAESVASEFTVTNIFHHVEEFTRERFGLAGLPLHPGESLFIAKAIIYVYEDAYRYEQNYELYDARWFQWLASLLVREPDLAEEDRGVLAAGELYFGAMYDAIMVGLNMVETATGERYGSLAEHRSYASRMVQAVQGAMPMDLSYAYLPLVLAGVTLNMRVKLHSENPWISLEMIEEARRGRAHLAGNGEETNIIFSALDGLIASAKELLVRSRISRT